MTTLSIVVLTLMVWGQRLGAVFLVGPRLDDRPLLTRAVNLVPAAVVLAVIVQLTVTVRGAITLDERLVGMTVAALLVWRRAPFLVVVLAAAAVTAAIRAVS